MKNMARELAKWIEVNLIVGQGRYAGQPVNLLPWQRRFLSGAFKPGVSSAALTLGRGNGKSTYAAMLGAACVKGPLAQPMGEVVVVASSFQQAFITHNHIEHFLQPWITKDKPRYRVWSSSNHAEIKDKQTGAGVRCIGSDPKRMMGLAPSLIIADEIASWLANSIDKSLAALDTSLGKLEGTRILYLGTRAADPEHPFEILINGGADYSQIHTAGPEDPPFQRRTWKKANPSLDLFVDLEAKIRKEAAQAKRNSSNLASFKSLRLNQGTSEVQQSLLLDAGVWEGIEVDTLVKPEGDYVLGLDTGTTVSMSAASAYFIKSGYLDGFGLFASVPGLAERGLSDGLGNLYVRMYEQGDLVLGGERVSDLSILITQCSKRWGTPAAMVCDRWRADELREVLTKIEYPRVPIIERGQGFKDGGEDVRIFRNSCLSGLVKPKRSLALRSAMATAKTIQDPAGNEKIYKNSKRIRDDLAVSSVLAVAQGERMRPQLERPKQTRLQIIHARR